MIARDYPPGQQDHRGRRKGKHGYVGLGGNATKPLVTTWGDGGCHVSGVVVWGEER